MPAMLDDPSAPTIYRTSGDAPYPNPQTPSYPADILPRQVTLRDRVTIATIVPFASRHQVPESLWTYLSDQLNKEIENGDTYPMVDGMPADKFASYWFQNFGAIMLLGQINSPEDVVDGPDWSTQCLGSFYIKPNYPGRSSHVCNAGFLVTTAARNRGVGRLMGETYIEWAPKLGYTYSVFNLVYETNVASCKIWDALGFKRIGRVPGCGNLKSYPDRFVDAIIYGRDLVSDPLNLVTEERFDKIKFYLKTGSYPAGADRAEKSRLRSAAMNYKLIPGSDEGDESSEKLMLRGKEVISDPALQYEISREIHNLGHGGINKTTSMIADKYHWVRIKETANLVIKNCPECKDVGKPPLMRSEVVPERVTTTTAAAAALDSQTLPRLSTSDVSQPNTPRPTDHYDDSFHDTTSHHQAHLPQHLPPHAYHHSAPLSSIRSHHSQPQDLHTQSYIDPQIMSDPSSHLTRYTTSSHPVHPSSHQQSSSAHSQHPHHQQHTTYARLQAPHTPDPTPYSTHDHPDDDAYHSMLNSHHENGAHSRRPMDGHDADLDMLLEDQDDEVDELVEVDDVRVGGG